MDALYIHIPFCTTICSYCDFYKMVAKPNVKTEYIKYLCDELTRSNLLYQDVNTIYIGGGTPSSLDLNLLKQLFQTLESYVDLRSLIEFTIECNIEDIKSEFIQICKDYHINRFSIGVQSFQPAKLQILGRHANLLDVLAKLEMIRSIYSNNINISLDLMYGIGDETLEDLNSDIDQVLLCQPDHISIYSLILEEKTKLHHLHTKGLYHKFDEDLERDMFDLIRTRLSSYGYIHYETSNFAKHGKIAVHNSKYWNHTPYLGVGAAASSFDGEIRKTNPRHLGSYYEYVLTNNESLCEVEILSKEDLMKEMIIVGLRKIEGISTQLFYERFSISIYEQFPIIDWMLEQKWLEEENQQLRLPVDKLYVANAILEKII